ncbi:helix-turn-helix transcriptional regulator [Streptomyces sp. CHA1]|uniref:helix-turn-helix domain-containing protein n=1 Tax=Streptomyces TaxID=1883 RepID=UPI0003C2F161|nr:MULTISPECIES: helix-turn-helix transcriptional regulator [unclassified Streptomyces]QOZ98964.1 XRE family transcriptional regulator [Streptomyces violascens]WSB22877.1 helix-turn-helix transcriptional regulator [Streptomyces albidoflavus]ESQ00367.1 DNA-binding protein [Streptomyces sp. GBA 94-10 4N24]ESQ05502.1 DNA-binding protein [Streptomyces sp. PVA_94-07]MBT3160659.1 helix-turn-helix transcriptional regulator [Streptomyces sp. G11C]
MQQRKKSSKKVTSWEVVGAQLAEFRRSAGLTQPQLAGTAKVGEDTLASIEQGRRRLKADLAELLDTILNTKRALATAVSKIPDRERYPAFAQEFVEHEQEALTLLSYQNHVIPGLLQTPEYVEQIYANLFPPLSSEATEVAIRARLDRQNLLHREPPPVMNFIIEESVFQRHMGNPDGMRRQIRHLRECADLPFIGIQVMLTATDAHAGLAGPLVLLETPDHDHLAYAEGQHNGFLMDDPDEVSAYQQRYGMLRSQALSPQRTKSLLNTLLE